MELPKVSFPIPHSTRVSRMLDILPAFTDEDLENDEKLARILGEGQIMDQGPSPEERP